MQADCMRLSCTGTVQTRTCLDEMPSVEDPQASSHPQGE